MKKNAAKQIASETDTQADAHCVQSMYLRPSGDLTIPFDKHGTLVLETDLKIQPGHECGDIRLGDLLEALPDVVEMARTGHRDVDFVEIMCMPRRQAAAIRAQ